MRSELRQDVGFVCGQAVNQDPTSVGGPVRLIENAHLVFRGEAALLWRLHQLGRWGHRCGHDTPGVASGKLAAAPASGESGVCERMAICSFSCTLKRKLQPVECLTLFGTGVASPESSAEVFISVALTPPLQLLVAAWAYLGLLETGSRQTDSIHLRLFTQKNRTRVGQPLGQGALR